MNGTVRSLLCLLAIVVGASICRGQANTATVPALAGLGNGNNLLPYFLDDNRYQQIFAASSFPQGGVIDRIRYRTEEGRAVTAPSMPVDMSISLGYAARTVGTASPSFVQNTGAGFISVLDGLVNVTLGQPNGLAFNAEIDVADLFEYDPSKGDLLLEVVVRTSTPPALDLVFDSSGDGQQTTTQRIFSSSATATMGTVGANSSFPTRTGLVTQFVFVPEPSGAAIALAILVGLGLHGRRHG
jgi:hypothetical protein